MTSPKWQTVFVMAVLFGITAMAHQMAVVSWDYGWVAPRGHGGIDFGTSWVAGGPSLGWGCVIAWLAMRVSRSAQVPLLFLSLAYFLLVVSLLPLVCSVVHGMPPSLALEQTRLVLALSVLGLMMGMGWLFALRDVTTLLPIVVRGVACIAPLLFLMWRARRPRVPVPSGA